MMCVGIGADSITFVIIISALAAVTEAEYSSSIHGSVIKKGFDCYVNLENAMLGMYVKYGNTNAALTLFTEMGGRRDVVSHTILINGYIKTGFIDLARNTFDRRFEKDLVMWNSMISGYVESNNPNEALVLFKKMENEEVEPDEYTVVTILAACACLSDLQYGRHVHRLILTKNTLHDVFVGTALIDKLGSEDHAVRVLLSNFYALAGEWSKVEEMRRSMKIFGMLKEPGISCVGVTT
ncbi:hypothetical protein RHMOL_Rhmol02G0205700 [Rhododendron molle]|uniref:Uncharacterized protein n=1 Tax=Rhododendron molle TaxID=49168 RepID=A0ACC0PVD4_RHOML|nr:hypothetical protein RHMOL_Rhmol02G0205700 [Rhododendron molle]